MSSLSLACAPTPLARRRLSRAETRAPAVRAASARGTIDDDTSASSDSPTAAAPVGRRASLLAAATAMTTSAMTSFAPVPPRSFAASADAFGTTTNMRALAKAFEEAMAAGADYDAADRAWTKAIELAPLNSAAWSNRGTKRLQAGRWADARADLERSVELSPDPNNPDPLTLNNLGNAEGALGNWDAAMANYLEASKDPSREMESIALANLALAKFQVNDVDGSLRVARTILRRDPEFWDVRALATAALWASGRETDAEAEWQALCRSGRGFGAPVSAENARDGRGGIEGDVAYAARLLEQQVRLFQSLYQPVRAFRLTLRLTWSFVCRWRSKPRWFAGRSARTARGGTDASSAGTGAAAAGAGWGKMPRVECTSPRRSSRRGGRRDAPRRWTRF